MKRDAIRAIAVCVFRHQGRIFVAEYEDPTQGRLFYRPLGGTIEFGEYSREAASREILEETGFQATHLRYLGTLENIFTYQGRRGHEIVLVYEGAFVERGIYSQPGITGVEGDGSPIKAVWKPLAEFLEPGAPPLYPTGLIELLMEGR